MAYVPNIVRIEDDGTETPMTLNVAGATALDALRALLRACVGEDGTPHAPSKEAIAAAQEASRNAEQQPRREAT
jgi:hypothetical protein